MDLIHNILRMYDQATAMDRQEGKEWYDTAHYLARYFAREYRVTTQQAAGVIAVLSPRTVWADNLLAAEKVLEHWCDEGSARGFEQGNLRVTGINIAKAFKFLEGHEEVLHGPKVEAFFDNIMVPRTSMRVTVDGWTYRIAHNCLGVDGVPNIRGRRYDKIEMAYVWLAYHLNLLPSELQAITWVTAHRISEKTIDDYSI